MINNRNLMLSLLVSVLVGLPIAMAIDRGTDLLVDSHFQPEGQSYTRQDTKLMEALLDQVKDENRDRARKENRLLQAVETVESHGDPNAVSPKGAKGRYQLMDRTAKNPGFGVRPLRNRSQKEQKRFAGDYLDAQQRRYARMLAEAAYNAGPSAVDKALRKAFAQLPTETQRYTIKVEQQLAQNEE